MTIGSLFSGIGGLELGLEACGLGPVVWQCDNDPHALAVLAEHWPTVRRYSDVREIDGDTNRVDILCGGFPCQPHSVAGKRRGTSDARWLWPEFWRIISALRPACVFIENVPGLRTSGLSVVLADLAGLGFDAEWDYFSAAETGAPHRRKRLFILAYSDGEWIRDQSGRAGGPPWATSPFSDGIGPPWVAPHANQQCVGQPNSDGASVRGRQWSWRPSIYAGRWEIESPVSGMADGNAGRVDRERLLGNAVVPQQAALAWRTLITRAKSARVPKR